MQEKNKIFLIFLLLTIKILSFERKQNRENGNFPAPAEKYRTSPHLPNIKIIFLCVQIQSERRENHPNNFPAAVEAATTQEQL